MKATVKKWGNSAAVRIPASILDVREEAGRIVIEPVRREAYDLDDLLKKVTRRNLRKTVDFGPPVGKEIW
jgi:antitoxin MazE